MTHLLAHEPLHTQLVVSSSVHGNIDCYCLVLYVAREDCFAHTRVVFVHVHTLAGGETTIRGVFIYGPYASGPDAAEILLAVFKTAIIVANPLGSAVYPLHVLSCKQQAVPV